MLRRCFAFWLVACLLAQGPLLAYASVQPKGGGDLAHAFLHWTNQAHHHHEAYSPAALRAHTAAKMAAVEGSGAALATALQPDSAAPALVSAPVQTHGHLHAHGHAHPHPHPHGPAQMRADAAPVPPQPAWAPDAEVADAAASPAAAAAATGLQEALQEALSVPTAAPEAASTGLAGAADTITVGTSGTAALHLDASTESLAHVAGDAMCGAPAALPSAPVALSHGAPLGRLLPQSAAQVSGPYLSGLYRPPQS